MWKNKIQANSSQLRISQTWEENVLWLPLPQKPTDAVAIALLPCWYCCGRGSGVQRSRPEGCGLQSPFCAHRPEALRHPLAVRCMFVLGGSGLALHGLMVTLVCQRSYVTFHKLNTTPSPLLLRGCYCNWRIAGTFCIGVVGWNYRIYRNLCCCRAVLRPLAVSPAGSLCSTAFCHFSYHLFYGQLFLLKTIFQSWHVFYILWNEQQHYFRNSAKCSSCGLTSGHCFFILRFLAVKMLALLSLGVKGGGAD